MLKLDHTRLHGEINTGRRQVEWAIDKQLLEEYSMPAKK